jgi:hypothetical protein
MRLLVWFACAVIVVMSAGCVDFTAHHVLEVKCWANSGLNDEHLCLKPSRLGAELEIRVNDKTQAVQISVVKNDGNWGGKDFILDHCVVVDFNNWECTNRSEFMADVIYTKYTMSNGRYYHSLTSRDASTDAYTSSIAGLTFFALYYGIIDQAAALIRSGYSPRVLSGFGKDL